MKRNLFIFGLSVLTVAFFTSCDEDHVYSFGDRAEIESATLENSSVLQKDPLVEGDKVTFDLLEENPDGLKYSPEFELSKGATITPKNGTERDFSEPQEYTINSEDGKKERKYTVEFNVNELATTYSYENVKEVEEGGLTGTQPIPAYHKFYEVVDGDEHDIWASGNDGISILIDAITDGDPEPEDYPTHQIADGHKGKAAELVTQGTGTLGATFGSPLAAGNLFIGDFDLDIADPVSSAKFGKPYGFDHAPEKLTGYFKYKAGDDFQVNSDEGTDLEKDIWDAYAVLFEESDPENYLEPDYQNDERVVSIAKLDDDQRTETDEWTEFEIPFKSVNGKSFDPDKDYMYTIVFAASKEGEAMNGAPGSTLQIDEVQLITEGQ